MFADRALSVDDDSASESSESSYASVSTTRTCPVDIDAEPHALWPSEPDSCAGRPARRRCRAIRAVRYTGYVVVVAVVMIAIVLIYKWKLRKPDKVTALYTFQVSTKSIPHRGFVRVRYAYNDEWKVSGDDWIQAYCLDDQAQRTMRWTAGSFIGRQQATSRAGSVMFGPLPNLRCSWVFQAVTISGDVLATTDLVHFERGPTEPLQVHLSLEPNTTAVRVTWISAGVASPVVKYGEVPEDLRTIEATGATYKNKDLCGKPAQTPSTRYFRDPGFIYSAVMPDLFPGVRYFYQVGDASGRMSEVLTFDVPIPEDGYQGGEFIVVPAGQGSGGGLLGPGRSTAITKLNASLAMIQSTWSQPRVTRPRFVAQLGSLVFGRGSTMQWDEFGLVIEQVASKVPYVVANGVRDSGVLGECGIPTKLRFPASISDNSFAPHWYSFNSGFVHYVVIAPDAETLNVSGAWLREDLSRVKRQQTPFVFVHLQQNFYRFPRQNESQEAIRKTLDPIFTSANISAVFSENIVAYERSCRMSGGECSATTGVVHFSLGYSPKNAANTIKELPTTMKLLHDDGFGRVTIHNDTHAQFQYVLSRDGKVADSVFIGG